MKGLKKRGHQILSCLGDGNPDCINFPRSKWGAIRLARQADVVYIRIAGVPVFSFLDQSTLLKLIRPRALPVIWEVNAPVEELKGGFPPGAERDTLIRKENRKRKWLAKLVDAGIGVSVVLKDYIRDVLGIKKAYFIPNGSDPHLFDPKKIKETALTKLHDRFKVIWAGNAVTPWQGIDLILETANKIQHIDPDIVFVILTGDSLWKFPILKNLFVLKEVPYFDFPHYLLAADVCLCLYKSLNDHIYGFYNSPLKLFDGMAAGLPIIASDIGQISAVIRNGHNGLLVDNSIDSIVEKILELKKDRDKRIFLGNNARSDVIEFYNWDRVSKQTEDVLIDACCGKT
jgi:glycosyltransferase involved in cell wall biosynthesis